MTVSETVALPLGDAPIRAPEEIRTLVERVCKPLPILSVTDAKIPCGYRRDLSHATCREYRTVMLCVSKLA